MGDAVAFHLRFGAQGLDSQLLPNSPKILNPKTAPFTPLKNGLGLVWGKQTLNNHLEGPEKTTLNTLTPNS